MPKLLHIDKKAQARLDVLMMKNNEGTITIAERKELTVLGDTAERLSLENAKTLARQAEARRGKGSTKV